MNKLYYLFQISEDGTIVALDKAIGLDQVKERLTNLTALKPGKCLVYDPIETKFVEPFKKSA